MFFNAAGPWRGPRPRLQLVGRGIPPLVGAPVTQTVPEANRAKMLPGQKVNATITVKNAGNAAGKFKIHGTIWRASTGTQVDKFLCDGAEWPVQDLAAGQSLTITFNSAAAWPSGYGADEKFTASWSIWVTDPATGIEVDKLEVQDQQAIVNLAIAKVQWVSSTYSAV